MYTYIITCVSSLGYYVNVGIIIPYIFATASFQKFNLEKMVQPLGGLNFERAC